MGQQSSNTPMYVGQGLNAAGDIYGAYSQSQAQNANLAAQTQWRNQLLGLVQGQMQSGQNPYSQDIMNFLGMGQQGPSQQGQGPNGLTQFNGRITTMAPGSEAGPGGPNTSALNAGSWLNASPWGPDVSRALDLNRGPSDPNMPTTGQQYGGPSMYRYQPQNAPSYQASLISGLPQIDMNALMTSLGHAPGTDINQLRLGATPSVNAQNVSAQQLGQAPSIDWSRLGLGQPGQINPGSVNYQNAQLNTGVNVPTIGAPSLGQSFNTGQDAIMQMLRGGAQNPQDAALTQNLQSMYGNGGIDANQIIAGFQPRDRAQMEQQVGELRGSTGSLGQRLGSSSLNSEAMLRSNLLAQNQARDAGLTSQLAQQSAANRLQALGLGGTLEGQRGQLGLAGQGQQLNAAQALQSAGLAQGQLDLSAQGQNAQNALQAQGLSLDAATRMALQNSSLGLSAQQMNQQAGLTAQGQNAANSLQAGLAGQSTNLQALLAQLGIQSQYELANQGANLQAGLANQQAGLSASGQNANLAQQAGLATQSADLQALMQNAGLAGQYGIAGYQGGLQALLANQGLLGQGMFANAGAMNNAGQFNASMLQNQNQINAQQGNIYNQMMLGGFGQAAGLQNQQQSLNAQLLGILGGIGVPSQQASPWGGALSDMGSMMMLMPFLQNAGRQQQPPIYSGGPMGWTGYGT